MRTDNVSIYFCFSYMDELAKSGRLKNVKTLKEQKGRLVAEHMLMAGMDKAVQWVTSTECKIPSQTTSGTFYDVDIVNVTCNCPASTQGGKMFMHIFEI